MNSKSFFVGLFVAATFSAYAQPPIPSQQGPNPPPIVSTGGSGGGTTVTGGTCTNQAVTAISVNGVPTCTTLTTAYTTGIQSTTGTPAGFVIASQASGDILYASSATAWARLGKGSDGQVLTLASGLPSWAASTGGAPFADNAAIIKNNGDNTKLLIISAASITTGTTRTATWPDSDGTFITTGATGQTFRAARVGLGQAADAAFPLAITGSATSGGVQFTSGSGVVAYITPSGSTNFQIGTTSAHAICMFTNNGACGLTLASGGGTTMIGASAATGNFTVGASALTLTTGAIGLSKMTASASAPGAAGGKMEFVCGTNAGSAKLVIYAGTSGTAVTVVDNIGAGVTGC